MLKRYYLFLCFCVFLAFGSALVTAEQDTGEAGEVTTEYENTLCIPTGSFMIHPPKSVDQKRASVDFPHSVHFVYNCNDCHHKWEEAAGIRNCTTSGCHDLFESPKKPLVDGSYTPESIKYYKYAYHDLCRGCHKKLRVSRTNLGMSSNDPGGALPVPGPTGCIECHPKE